MPPCTIIALEGFKNLPRAMFPRRRGSIMFRQFLREGFFMDMPAHGVLKYDKKGEGRYGGGIEARYKRILPLGIMHFLCKLAYVREEV
jgi:hypothetical protein